MVLTGPIVRYGANSLSISTPEALQAIHGAKANIKKGDWYKTLDISAGAPSVQMEIDKQQHAMRRRFLAPAFSDRALKEAERLIAVSALKMTEGMSKLPEGAKKGDWTTPHNMGRWATFFGFDFIADLGYGQSFGMLENDENRWIPDVLRSASIFIYYVGYLPFIDLVRPLMGTAIQGYIFGQEAADSLKYTHLANSRLAERMDLEKQYKEKATDASQQRKDTFHYLLNSKDPVTGKGFTTEQLQADSALIIAAGSDGVGLTLAATIFYLICNPSALEKLTAEIRSAFSSADEIANPKLNSLPWLHACIEEALRMNPPKPSSVPRQVLKGGVTIDGRYFPQGATLGSPLYVLHHDPTYFPEPWEYKPERWIVDKETGVTAEDVAAAKSAFAPFLIGPMNCIGKNMSYIALKLALANLLWKCDVRKAGELTGGGREDDVDVGRRRWNEYQMQDWILGFRDGPMVEVRERI
jgi:cytochrome P450